MVYFEKSLPAPKSLAIEKKKKNGKYNSEDVLKQLQTDFKNKCYLCERKAPASINVEHFVAHQSNIDLKFDWNNLFWSCVHCNNTKLINYNNILNCTNIEDDVENALYYHMPPYPKELVRIEVLKTSKKAISTKELLLKIYNGSTKHKIIEAANIRTALLNDIWDFQNALLEYYNSDNDEEISNSYLVKIKRHLRRSSNFTAFKRWIIKKNPKLKQDLKQYFD